MLKRSKKTVCIITNDGVGIKAVVEKVGFEIKVVASHDDWAKYIWEIEECHLVILDEVDQFISGNLQLTDEEERILLGEGGPLVLVLVRDGDYRLDKRTLGHRRWVVHHKSEYLDRCLEELFHAKPNGNCQSTFYEYIL